MSIYDENEIQPPDNNGSSDEFVPESPLEAFLPERFMEEVAPPDPPEASTPPVEVVAPPVIEPPVPFEAPLKPADRSTMSQSTMLFGLMALSLSILGIGFLIFDVFQNGLMSDLLGTLVKAVPVALAYLVGLALCQWSMRSFSNLVLPLFIKFYLWVVLTGLVVLYIKIMQKLFEQNYDLVQFFSYNLVLAAGLVWLIGLHLLLEQQDLRRHSIPIIMACILHLILMVVRFLVMDQSSQAVYMFGDLYFFVVMFGLASLMLAHLGILNPLRRQVDDLFKR